ncbi:hypothetical protein ACIOD2_37405 [Amycolatopsis sp. NPDC088138]|uniref:hypothetical protein n=1 Tax=Amycolatopsis sp. NPDC088138 TaxID=3363938 RepID=UPI00380F8A50
MTTPTPWWGTLVVAAVGLLGVLVTVVVGAWRENERAEEARVERARERRSGVYAEFYRVIAAYRRAADELGDAANAHRQAKTRFGQVGPVKTIAQLTNDVRELGDSAAMMYGQIRFLAPLDVIAAAEQVVEALSPYQDALASGRTEGDEADALVQALDAAVERMRLDLGSETGRNASR